MIWIADCISFHARGYVIAWVSIISWWILFGHRVFPKSQLDPLNWSIIRNPASKTFFLFPSRSVFSLLKHYCIWNRSIWLLSWWCWVCVCVCVGGRKSTQKLWNLIDVNFNNIEINCLHKMSSNMNIRHIAVYRPEFSTINSMNSWLFRWLVVFHVFLCEKLWKWKQQA